MLRLYWRGPGRGHGNQKALVSAGLKKIRAASGRPVFSWSYSLSLPHSPPQQGLFFSFDLPSFHSSYPVSVVLLSPLAFCSNPQLLPLFLFFNAIIPLVVFISNLFILLFPSGGRR